MVEPIERELLNIVTAVKPLLSRDTVADISELAEAREWGLAFETLCSQLFEFDAVVPRSLRNRIAAVGERMGMEPSNWLDLRVDGE